MQILNLKTIWGPNVYHEEPVMILKVDLQDCSEKGSHEKPELVDRLLEKLPGLNLHTCSPGYPGGFVERLHRGTYPAHIIEHVALEISQIVGCGVTFGKTRNAGENGVYNIVTRFSNESGMKLCLETAFQFVKSLLYNEDYKIEEKLGQIRKVVQESKLGPSTEAIFQAARERGIPCRRIGYNSLIQLGYGKYRRRIQAAVTDRTSLIATDLVQDKFLTKELLKENGVPVPMGKLLGTEIDLLEALAEFNGPFVVKPLDGHHGQGVALNLKSKEEIVRAFKIAREYCPDILIEEMCEGRDFRALVIGGKFSAAAERTPPQIEGDGKQTVEMLIAELNKDPRRGEGHGSELTRITVDDGVNEILLKQGLSLTSVPSAGQKVLLRENANLSSGGTAKDVSDMVHPEVRTLCERISRIVDLDICGIDIIAQDLSTPMDSSFKVIEVNAGPGLRMHLSPTEGKPRNIGADIVNMLYPEGKPFRIPIAAVTGTNGKTTTVRLIAKILGQNGNCVGLTTSDGVWIGDEKIASGDTTGPQSTNLVLSDPQVQRAVLEVARGGILRGGLAYDWSDVGVITNVRPDHIGQDGIESLEDIVWIKSLVAERVRPGGTLVLNLDDKESSSLMESPRIRKIEKNYFLYSMTATHPKLIQHVKNGGDACWYDDGLIYMRYKGDIYTIDKASEIPCTLSGKAMFQVSNVLAAIAASVSIGATVEDVVAGLRSFFPNKENLGRLNIYKVGVGYLILDYGHNPDAIAAMGSFIDEWKGCKKTAVFGLPGDRADILIERSGIKASEYFDRIILRDDVDLRGRRPGEIPEMLQRYISHHNPEVEIQTILDQQKAVETALTQMSPHEVVVVFYDEFDQVTEVVRQFDPIPLDRVPVLEDAVVMEIKEWIHRRVVRESSMRSQH